jgi:hypothetical protein
MEVKVWNDNTHPYREEFKGNKIDIPAGKFVKMQDDEAVLFLGTMNPMKFDVDGKQDPKSYKKLRIEKIPQQKDQDK